MPDDEAKANIVAHLRLDRRQAALLWPAVERIADQIRRHGAWRAQPNVGSRAEALRVLRRMSRQLRAVCDLLKGADETTDAFVRSACADVLGRLLSNTAMREVRGRPFDLGSDPNDLVASARLHGEDIDRFLERESVFRRTRIARREARGLLLGLLRAIDESIGALLAIERENRGGSPGKLYRNYVVQELAPIYRALWNEAPTSTSGGRFVLLCELVLEALALETDGVEAAVPRLLGRIRLT
jgi:hypothetical protein